MERKKENYLDFIMLDYTLTQSARTKHLRLTVHHDGRMVVTVPKRSAGLRGGFLGMGRVDASAAQMKILADKMVKEKAAWIEAKREYFAKLKQKNAEREKKREARFGPKLVIKDTRALYEAHKVRARTLAVERVQYLNQFYGFTYGAIAIKRQKTRWGSCSKKGNLNFNYKIAFLPPHLADYLVVHELCHLGQFNHGPKFWALVSKAVPDYKERRGELKRVVESR